MLFRIKLRTKLIFRIFIFWKLTELCRFVTYLWDDPRSFVKSISQSGEGHWSDVRLLQQTAWTVTHIGTKLLWRVSVVLHVMPLFFFDSWHPDSNLPDGRKAPRQKYIRGLAHCPRLNSCTSLRVSDHFAHLSCEVLPSFSTPTPQSRLVAAYLWEESPSVLSRYPENLI